MYAIRRNRIGSQDYTRLIETDKFPADLINEASAREKSRGGMPPIWEMVFWWTRKPLIGARAIIAASLLPESVDKNEFLRLIRLDSNGSVVYKKMGVKGAESLASLRRGWIAPL